MELQLVVILDPDRASQPVLVNGMLGSSQIGRVSAAAREANVLLARDSVGISRTEGELLPCHERYGGFIGLGLRCVELDFVSIGGAEYDIEVIAEGRPAARARTVVPEQFAIVSHSIAGVLPGTVTLNAAWTSSPSAHRYVVTIRGTQYKPGYSCRPDAQCFKRWLVATPDTAISVTIDASYFEAAVGPFSLDVYAMNRDLYAYLMTGDGNSFFPVAPIQNVVGGFGVVGAWVVRSVPLQP